jgi:hypothetical protein
MAATPRAGLQVPVPLGTQAQIRVLRAFPKVRKATISFVVVWYTAPTGRIFIKFDKNNGYIPLRMIYIYDLISQFFLRPTRFFSPKIVPFM